MVSYLSSNSQSTAGEDACSMIMIANKYHNGVSLLVILSYSVLFTYLFNIDIILYIYNILLLLLLSSLLLLIIYHIFIARLIYYFIIFGSKYKNVKSNIKRIEINCEK